MVNIVVMGHGGYAEGVKQNLAMIVGVPEHMHFIDLTKEDDFQSLESKVDQVIAGFQEEEVLFVCDLLGASPFRVAAMLCVGRPDSYVTVSGINTMAFMELAMEHELNVKELAIRAIETTKASVAVFPE